LFTLSLSHALVYLFSAENGTYWAAARFLEAERVAPNRAVTSVAMNRSIHNKRPKMIPQTQPTKKKTTTKNTKTTDKPNTRKRSKNASATMAAEATTTAHLARPWKRAKKSVREAAVELMRRIVQVDTTATAATEDRVGDNHAQIVQKVRA
jgi:hypothetical protein